MSGLNPVAQLVRRFITALEVTAVGLPPAMGHVCRRVFYTGTLRCTAVLPWKGDDRYITGPVWFPPSQFAGLGLDGTGASRPAGLGSVRERLLAHCKSGARACTSATQPWAALSMRHCSSCSASPQRALSAWASTVSLRVRSATVATARHLPPLSTRGPESAAADMKRVPTALGTPCRTRGSLRCLWRLPAWYTATLAGAQACARRCDQGAMRSCLPRSAPSSSYQNANGPGEGFYITNFNGMKQEYSACS